MYSDLPDILFLDPRQLSGAPTNKLSMQLALPQSVRVAAIARSLTALPAVVATFYFHDFFFLPGALGPVPFPHAERARIWSKEKRHLVHVATLPAVLNISDLHYSSTLL